MTQYVLTKQDTALDELVRQAETGEPVTITRQGKLVARLVSVTEPAPADVGKKNFWEALQEMRSAPDFEPVDLTDEEIAS